jgi:hypothetical protein
VLEEAVMTCDIGGEEVVDVVQQVVEKLAGLKSTSQTSKGRLTAKSAKDARSTSCPPATVNRELNADLCATVMQSTPTPKFTTVESTMSSLLVKWSSAPKATKASKELFVLEYGVNDHEFY